jgi:ubiquinone/menaquinone biosynthesis C-methylase UbiE
MTEQAESKIDIDRIRANLIKYTRRAFQLLPALDRPSILDIGCGSGVPTMELASLSNGQITALDIDQPLLDRLRIKVEKAGLSDRVKVMKCSMSEMDFPDESFDIIWAEGSIAAIGFKRGLREWRRFLKTNGFLAVHDESGNIAEKLEQIAGCGYELIDRFILDEDIWWTEYYAPLEKMASELRGERENDPGASAFISNAQQEIDMFKKEPARCCSVFFIMKKV